MKLYIYNENCIRAGQSVPERILEQHENPDEGGDWTCYEGTEAELTAIANDLDQPGCANTFNRKVAQSIRELTAFSLERNP